MSNGVQSSSLTLKIIKRLFLINYLEICSTQNRTCIVIPATFTGGMQSKQISKVALHTPTIILRLQTMGLVVIRLEIFHWMCCVLFLFNYILSDLADRNYIINVACVTSTQIIHKQMLYNLMFP